MNKILYKITNGKPSFWLMRDVPDISDYDQHDDEMNAYSRIAFDRDMDNVKTVEIINPELLSSENGYYVQRGDVSYINGNELKDGDTFGLPEGLGFKEEYQFYCMGWCTCSEKEYHGWNQRENVKADTRKVIRLLPKQAETQDELWNEVGGIIDWSYQEMNASILKSKFTITRN